MIRRQAARVCVTPHGKSNPDSPAHETAKRDVETGEQDFDVTLYATTTTTSYYLNIIYSSIVVVRNAKYNLSSTSP